MCSLPACMRPKGRTGPAHLLGFKPVRSTALEGELESEMIPGLVEISRGNEALKIGLSTQLLLQQSKEKKKASHMRGQCDARRVRNSDFGGSSTCSDMARHTVVTLVMDSQPSDGFEKGGVTGGLHAFCLLLGTGLIVSCSTAHA
nr:hypothetical protein CFP56_02973 [Quercus suber]